MNPHKLLSVGLTSTVAINANAGSGGPRIAALSRLTREPATLVGEVGHPITSPGSGLVRLGLPTPPGADGTSWLTPVTTIVLWYTELSTILADETFDDLFKLQSRGA